MVAPSEIDLEDYNLSFCQVQDYNVSKLIEEKISAFESAISGTRTNNATIMVRFYEKRQTTKFWFQRAEEEVCWEQWSLHLRMIQSNDKRESRRLLGQHLLNCLKSISCLAQENKNHVPPITQQDPFPYRLDYQL